MVDHYTEGENGVGSVDMLTVWGKAFLLRRIIYEIMISKGIRNSAIERN